MHACLEETDVERILVVAYRPNAGKREELLAFLAAQHRRGRELGLLDDIRPLLGEGTHGEIVYIVTLRSGTDVDRLWEDPVFQDLDASLSMIARMVPLQTLDEAAASYMDMASLPVHGGTDIPR
jgi:hypothetical protein